MESRHKAVWDTFLAAVLAPMTYAPKVRSTTSLKTPLKIRGKTYSFRMSLWFTKSGPETGPETGTESGVGPPVLLLHGLFGSGDNLGVLARALSANNAVYSIDLPNHGRSPSLDPATYPEMARTITALMDDEKIETAALVGHSMGGKVAMQVALDHGDRVERLIVADIAPVQYPAHHNTIIEALNDLDLGSLTSRGQASEALADAIPEAGVRAFLVRSLERSGNGFRWKLDLQALTNSYPDIMKGLTGRPYAGPTLFIKGSESDYMVDEYRDATTTLFPKAKLSVIAGAGHWLHAEKPEQFNRLVTEFLDG